ncbi:uncharacterized protein LOC110977038 [Acanthaster planci]|uniref:Uncharacterized protein LOC110977038 n=1 Tax=Acanthaster planci TaxID=133434 RepID=A0A8B7Y3N9_ACAPL|nr:uncharacterized protein LOC110977038 [Acanthaster planci]
MHWKQYTDGLCIVGLGGGSSPAYLTRSASTSRASGRLATLQNSQRLFVSPKGRNTSHANQSPASIDDALPEIAPGVPRTIDIDIGVQGKAKTIHPCIVSPRDVGTPVVSDEGPLYRVKQGVSEKTDSKSSTGSELRCPQPAVHHSYPQHALRTRSPASNSVASFGDLSITSVSLSSRTVPSRKSDPEIGSSVKDGESEYLSEILGEYVSLSPSPVKGSPQEATPRGTPKRPSTNYHSKLLHMRSLLRDNGQPSDSVTTQTVDLEKDNIKSFKKLLVLTQIPKTSKSPKSKLSNDSCAVISESSASASSTDSAHRERNMLLGLHQLSRQHTARRNSNPGANRIDADSSVLGPEQPFVQPSPPTMDERPVKTMVDQWLGDCPVVGNRMELDSTKRRIEFSVPSIEEEAET